MDTLEMKEVEAAIEGILFASGEPVAVERICMAMDMDRPTVELVLQRLQDYYSYERRGIRLLKMEDSYQLCSAPEYGDQIRKAFEIRKPAKLSQPALEVLTIIAYYQPTTRAYVDQIRGVDSSYTVGLLLDRHLIEECGRLQVPGRPRLYRTTQSFLRAFHLNSLEDLPQMPGLEADGQMRLDDEGNLPTEGEKEEGGALLVALWILGILLLLIILLLLLRVGVRIRFGDELCVTATAGPIRLQLVPKPEKEKKEKPKKETASETKKEGGEKKSSDKKLPLGLTFADIRSALPALWFSLKRGLRRTRQRLRIDPMRLSVCFGGDDPAQVAETYGWANVAMWTVMPEVEKLTRMPDPRIHLETDFNAAETRVSGEVGLSFRIGDLVSIGIAFAGPALKWFRAFRKAQMTQEKQAAREREAAQRNTKDQAPAAADATHTTN